MGLVTFAASILRKVPPWLSGRVGGAILGGMLEQADGLTSSTTTGVKARFPGYVADALPVIGRERRIVRGLAEPSATYENRLRRWLDDHRRRGGSRALLAQLGAFYADNPRQIDLVYASGTRTILHDDGTITRDHVTWRDTEDPAEWAQIWIFVHLPDGVTSVSYVEARSVISIVTDWNAAHVGSTRIFGLYPGGDLWDYPPGSVWDDDEDLTWDEPMAIDFFDVAPPVPLTIDGDTLTIDGDPITV